MQKQKREYRSFQVNIAPGLYGGITLVGTSVFFITEGKWLYTVLALGLIFLACFSDRPFKFTLFCDKKRLIAFIALVSLSLSIPAFVFQFGSALSEFIGLILIPVGGLLVSLFVHITYKEEFLQKEGWVNVTGRWE